MNPPKIVRWAMAAMVVALPVGILSGPILQIEWLAATSAFICIGGLFVSAVWVGYEIIDEL